METTIDYTAVLADLERKRDEIDRAIAGIKVVLGLASSQSIITAEQAQANNGAIPEDAFFGLSIAEAAKKLLSIKKKPLATPEITEALRAGGLHSASESFGNTVGSIMNRNADGTNSIFVRVSRGTWGLRSWYPGIRSIPKRPEKPPLVGTDQSEKGSDETSEDKYFPGKELV